jgi:hypothetical protein
MNALHAAVDGNHLNVVADVSGAWGHHEKNYGFFDWATVPYGAGMVRVEVKVVTSPSGTAESVKAFPLGLDGKGSGEHSKYILAGGKPMIEAPMDTVMSSSLPLSGKPGFSDPNINIAKVGRTKYWLSVCVRFYESDPPRPGDTQESGIRSSGREDCLNRGSVDKHGLNTHERHW